MIIMAVHGELQHAHSEERVPHCEKRERRIRRRERGIKFNAVSAFVFLVYLPSRIASVYMYPSSYLDTQPQPRAPFSGSFNQTQNRPPQNSQCRFLHVRSVCPS
jgi:hypothetical protein